MSSPAKKKITADEELPPKTWWQWVILYPALFLAIVTAVPQWVQMAASWKSGISTKELADAKELAAAKDQTAKELAAAKDQTAKEQSALWSKNWSCSTSAPLDSFYVNPKNVSVDAYVCASGDVFVRMISPEKKGSFYWVDADKVLDSHVASMFTSQAFAAELTEYSIAQNSLQDTSQGSIMCQKFLDDRNLLRVVNVNGTCFDEVVDTFMGVTVSQTPSQCRSTC
jgi:hypothetical protein